MAATTAKKNKVAHYAERLAVSSEPGLTTAQLMLYNHDLAPVEPERRQWGMFREDRLFIQLLTAARCMELRGLLGRRFLQHQHVDDLRFQHR